MGHQVDRACRGGDPCRCLALLLRPPGATISGPSNLGSITRQRQQNGCYMSLLGANSLRRLRYPTLGWELNLLDLVSNALTLETPAQIFRLCERQDDHGVSNTAERCGGGTADAGEVVTIGSRDPLNYAEVAEPAKLA